MQMVELKVSATLLALLSALAQIGIGTLEFGSNHEVGFYFSIWKDECKRKVYNTVRFLFQICCQKLHVFVICCRIMFHTG